MHYSNENISGMNLGLPYLMNSPKRSNLVKLCQWTLLTFFLSCGSPQKQNTNKEVSQTAITLKAKTTEKKNQSELKKETTSPKKRKYPKLNVVVRKDKSELLAYYENPIIKEFYDEMLNREYIEPRPLNIPENLDDLSYGDLRLLRNEIFARNGYLFSDGFLRGYFNRFDWYLPIFEIDTFKVILNQSENNLVHKLLREEKERRKAGFVKKDGLSLYNSELVVNEKQFQNVPGEVLEDLRQQNFSIVEANRSMPFYVYDKNAYQFIPHYITTDLYLFILHKYFSTFLEGVDAKYMYPTLKKMLNDISIELVKRYESSSDRKEKDALGWAQTFISSARHAISGTTEYVLGVDSILLAQEASGIDQLSGKPYLVPNDFVSYAELKPRGHYTKSDELKAYFRAFKWIAINGIDISDTQSFNGIIAIATLIKQNPLVNSSFTKYISKIEKLAGTEDKISIKDLIEILPSEDLSSNLSEPARSSLLTKLYDKKKERVKAVFGESFETPEKGKKRIYFLSSTYSLSGEIFSRLVHINGLDSKRPFPRALDLPAVFGNKMAEKIIKEEYKDSEKWPAYDNKLLTLQNQFADFNNWNSNYGVRAVKTALSSTYELDTYPDFMKTRAYNKKELNTMLASWTHIKHDLILYQAKPYGAEAGQGGGPAPPKHLSYVEPNLEFWNEAINLVKWLEKLLPMDDSHKFELGRILKLGRTLKRATEVQLKGEHLPDELYSELSYVGGTIEYILLGLIDSPYLPERQKSMALIADVYSYNGINLNVAVGHADDIHVVVPINGEYYIARGSTFSFYEFTEGKIYNDEEWKSKVRLGATPSRPNWINPMINKTSTLTGDMQFRYVGYGSDY